jgi:hypothetical protein
MLGFTIINSSIGIIVRRLIGGWDIKAKFVRFEERLHSIPINLFLEIFLHSSACVVELSVKVAHPDHDQFVISSCGEVVSFLVEINGSYFSLMAENCPAKTALLQLPYFDLVVTGD